MAETIREFYRRKYRRRRQWHRTLWTVLGLIALMAFYQLAVSLVASWRFR
jgi:hypothetical protein